MGDAAHAQHSGSQPVALATPDGALSDLLRMVSVFAEMDLGTPDQAKAYWVTMGHIGQVPSEVAVYVKAAREAGQSGTICEVDKPVANRPKIAAISTGNSAHA